MARFLLLTIIAFIALTFLMTFLKGALRRAMNMQPPSDSPHNAAKNQASRATPPSQNNTHKELYRNNDIIVLQGEATPDAVPKHKV